MAFPNQSEMNVIVLNIEASTTYFPILTITSTMTTSATTTSTANQSIAAYAATVAAYPSIIVNFYNETNVFFNNNLTSAVTSTIAAATSATVTAYGNLTTKQSSKSSDAASFQNSVIVPLYAVIFLLSVVGNVLVILTLAQNKRMRTVTNVYLLNLAVSDLLLGVFCMPFTLVGQMLRNFIFGKLMCKLIPYFQAVSVSVAIWTLVAISLERYFAICRPLTSRRWQTQFHAYKMIILVWIISFVCNSPLLIVQQLQPLNREKNKCREVWPSPSSERTYVIFLDIALLLLPLLAMGVAYLLIVSKLWRGLKREMKHTSCGSTKECFAAKRSQSMNTVNGILIGGTNSEGGAPQYSTVASPSRSQKNRVIVTSAQVNNCKTNYVNSLQEKFKKNSSGFKNPNNSTHSLKLSGGSNKPKKQNAKSVKLWLFKSIVQVRPNVHQQQQPQQRNGDSPPQQQPFHCEGNNNSTANNHGTIINNELDHNGPSAMGEHNNTGGNGGGGGGGKPSVEIEGDSPAIHDVTTYTFCRHAIRSTYMDKSIEAKKKVIRMLFVIIVEFFVCWAPLHILNTVYLFSPAFVYHHVSSTGIALVQLMAYISSCCNPITYCFMNRRFRQAFMAIFNCYNCRKCCCSETTGTNDGNNSLRHHELIAGVPCNSDASGNDSIVYLGRPNGLNRSEVLVLEAEDRV